MDTASYINEAPCPFCGHNAVSDEGFGDFCAHFVVSWTRDLDDDGGGVLGESVGWREPLPAEPLALAIQGLNAEVIDVDDSRYQRKLTRLRNMFAPNREPRWWLEVCIAIRDQANEPIGPSDRELGRISSQIMPFLLYEVPGIVLMAVNVGGGATISTDSNFVWAKAAETARVTIHQRLEAAMQVVQLATGRLAVRGSARRRP